MVGTATSNTPRTRTEFLLRHPDADRVLEEYPACRGANMRAGGTLKLQHDQAAAAVAQPAVAAATAAAADTRFSAKKTGTANSWQQQWK